MGKNALGRMALSFSTGIDSIVEHNHSFDKGVLRVCYVGGNRNGSFISKDTFEDCMPSIYNCPIVCRYDRDNDEIGSHDVELVNDEDGGIHIVNITQPVGVVPSDAKYWWEKMNDENGNEHEYLCVEVLLWKRQEAYNKIKNNEVTDESMEISVKDGKMIDGVYVINKFEFLAFCLLGTAEPCYESASLELFEKNDFMLQMSEMMEEFKLSFADIKNSYSNEDNLKGGNFSLKDKKKLIEEFGIDESALDFNIEEVSFDELKDRLEKFASENKNNDNQEGNENTDSYALASQISDAIADSVRSIKRETECGEFPKYWMVDYDAELSEVYCYDSEDWNLYGFKYSMNGDNVEIDFESKKRKKYAIVDFNEGDAQQTFMLDFANAAESSIKELTTKASEFENKFNEVSAEFESAKTEINELRAFKSEIESNSLKEEKNNIFKKFEDLNEVEEFSELKNNMDEFTASEIEEKCYAIMGKQYSTGKFSVNKHEEVASVRIPANGVYPAGSEQKTSPYGGVFEEFGIVSK